MKPALASLFAILFLGLTGCVMEEPSKQADAFTKTPKVETGHPSEHESCEVKGSGATNPCNTSKTAPTATGQDQGKFRKAMAVPFPADCREVKLPPYQPGASGDASDKAFAAVDACDAYARKIAAIYGSGGEKPKNMPPELESRWTKAITGLHTSFASVRAYADASVAYAGTLVIRDKPAKSPSARSPAGDGCANPFGGPHAPAGQFICSNQGELQACQCSGGSCSLKPTGSFLCTSPGAVIR